MFWMNMLHSEKVQLGRLLGRHAPDDVKSMRREQPTQLT